MRRIASSRAISLPGLLASKWKKPGRLERDASWRSDSFTPMKMEKQRQSNVNSRAGFGVTGAPPAVFRIVLWKNLPARRRRYQTSHSQRSRLGE
jgi:hypothetical protein